MDQLSVFGVFMLGASAGSIVSYIKLTNQFRTELGLSSSTPRLFPPEVPHDTVHFRGLLLSCDTEVIAMFSRLLRESNIYIHTCKEPAIAIEQLRSSKFDVLILDFDQLQDCSEVLKTVQGIQPNHDIVVFALASGKRASATSLELGGTFVVQRPVLPDQIRDLLHTACGRIMRSAQASFRLDVSLPVWVQRTAGPSVQCATINLSRHGMSVIAPAALKGAERLGISFNIPNTDIIVDAEGTVIWDDGHGKAGIKFESVSDLVRTRFYDWLHDLFSKGVDGTKDYDVHIPWERVTTREQATGGVSVSSTHIV
jgi:DNA-binding NarL/FixJ family response regulator